MYLEYFGLLKAPFHITPDPDFLYMSPSHREAFAALFYGVEQRKGFISVTGEVGAGKTTILRALCDILSAKRARMALGAPTGRAAKRMKRIKGHRSARRQG